MHTILVIGGYGFFGGRISAALAKNPSVRLLIGGRSVDSGRRMARELGLKEEQAVCVDADSPKLSQDLSELRVGTIVHTAGPFQNQDYSVARAAIDAGCHYIDLADGRQFVGGIVELDAAAKARGVTVVSGASSGARSPGLATVRGVFSYAGKPIRTLRNGSWVSAYGWRGLIRHRFPSPLGRRWLGACDVPDLDVLPQRYPTVATVSFHAGFASDAGHLLVWVLAGLVKAGWMKSMTACASPLIRISRWIEPLVSDKGGMFIALDGTGSDGQKRRMTWNLIAEHNHGPFIPCGASIVLATKLAGKHKLPIGAMPCVGLITVAEYLAALRELDVQEVVE